MDDLSQDNDSEMKDKLESAIQEALDDETYRKVKRMSYQSHNADEVGIATSNRMSRKVMEMELACLKTQVYEGSSSRSTQYAIVKRSVQTYSFNSVLDTAQRKPNLQYLPHYKLPSGMTIARPSEIFRCRSGCDNRVGRNSPLY